MRPRVRSPASPLDYFLPPSQRWQWILIWLLAKIGTKLQWRNRLAHGTYRQYKRHAGVVSSSLTWSKTFVRRLFWTTESARIKHTILYVAVVAEWLRRWTWNPMGFPRAGSNPAGCEIVFVPLAFAQGLNFFQIFLWLREASIAQWQSTGLVNQGSRVQSSLEAFFGHFYTKNIFKKANPAPPGNRTRVARMGILHDTTTPAAHPSALE